MLAAATPASSACGGGPSAKKWLGMRCAADIDQLQFVQVNGVKLAIAWRARVFRCSSFTARVIRMPSCGRSSLEPFSKHHLVVTYDRRGHGMSDDPTAGYSETAHAEDLNALLVHSAFAMRISCELAGWGDHHSVPKLYPRKSGITFADATIPLTDQRCQRIQNAPKAMNGASFFRAGLATRSAKKSSSEGGARLARSHTIQQRMADPVQPTVAMNQRSIRDRRCISGQWNSRDFPDMTKMYQPMFVIVGEADRMCFSRVRWRPSVVSGPTFASRRQWPARTTC